MTTQLQDDSITAHVPRDIRARAHATRREYLTGGDESDIAPSAAAFGIVLAVSALAALVLVGPPGLWRYAAPPAAAPMVAGQPDRAASCPDRSDASTAAGSGCARAAAGTHRSASLADASSPAPGR